MRYSISEMGMSDAQSISIEILTPLRHAMSITVIRANGSVFQVEQRDRHSCCFDKSLNRTSKQQFRDRHGNNCDDDGLLGCDEMKVCVLVLTLRKNFLPLSSL
jgi:hypothetical protein